MGKKKQGIALVLVGVLAMVLLVGCASPSPEKTVERFIKSYNKMDADGVLDCIEPTTAQSVRAMFKLLGDGIGLDMQSVLELMPSLMLAADDYYEEGMPRLKIERMEAVVEGDFAEIETTLSYGDEVEQEVHVFELEKIDGEWYITDID